jgi:asparagine synthase (glutamine-hydrolysing)
MVSLNRHRGPEGEHVLSFDRAVLGHCWLSFQDRHYPEQPVQSVSGDVAVSLNGEIYNHRALRLSHLADYDFATGSDTETILALYQRYGEKSFAFLSGMFAISIWDARTNTLCLARDRLGKKPLYVAETAHFIAFSSERSGLTCLPGVDLRVDAKAVNQYLLSGAVDVGTCLSKGISKVPPGGVAIYRDGAPLLQYRLPALDRVRAEVDAESIQTSLRCAIAARVFPTDVRHGVFVSGGVDSALVAALDKEVTGAPPLLFHVRMNDSRYDESAAARRLAFDLGSELRILTVTGADIAWAVNDYYPRLDEPIADPSFAVMLLLCRAASKEVRYALTGDGADDLFAGYNVHLIEPLLGRDDASILAIADQHHAVRTGAVGRGEVMVALAAMRKYEPAIAGVIARASFTASDVSHFLAKKLRLDPEDVLLELKATLTEVESLGQKQVIGSRAGVIRSMLQSRILPKIDRSSMMNGFELRSPFLDDLVVTAALSTPMGKLIQDGITKVLLRKAAALSMNVSSSFRPKLGFRVPIDTLTRNELSGTIARCLSTEAIEEGGILDAAAVKTLLAQHYGDGIDHSAKLWPLMCLQLWRSGVS